MKADINKLVKKLKKYNDLHRLKGFRPLIYMYKILNNEYKNSYNNNKIYNIDNNNSTQFQNENN